MTIIIIATCNYDVWCMIKKNTRLEVNKVKPKVWLTTPNPTPEFVYSECWYFDNDATSKIYGVLTEMNMVDYHVLPLAIHLRFFYWSSESHSVCPPVNLHAVS